ARFSRIEIPVGSSGRTESCPQAVTATTAATATVSSATRRSGRKRGILGSWFCRRRYRQPAEYVRDAVVIAIHPIGKIQSVRLVDVRDELQDPDPAVGRGHLVQILIGGRAFEEEPRIETLVPHALGPDLELLGDLAVAVDVGRDLLG